MKSLKCDKCGNNLNTQDIKRSQLAAGVEIEYIFCPRCGKRYMITLHDMLSERIRAEKPKNIKEKLTEHQKVLECVYEEEIKKFIGS